MNYTLLMKFFQYDKINKNYTIWNCGEKMLEFSRTERLIGKESLDKLKNANIIIFGLGGVGSYIAEALAR